MLRLYPGIRGGGISGEGIYAATLILVTQTDLRCRVRRTRNALGERGGQRRTACAFLMAVRHCWNTVSASEKSTPMNFSMMPSASIVWLQLSGPSITTDRTPSSFACTEIGCCHIANRPYPQLLCLHGNRMLGFRMPLRSHGEGTAVTGTESDGGGRGLASDNQWLLGLKCTSGRERRRGRYRTGLYTLLL